MPVQDLCNLFCLCIGGRATLAPRAPKVYKRRFMGERTGKNGGKILVFREPGRLKALNRTTYMPHQGHGECARRRVQIGRGIIPLDQTIAPRSI